MAELIRQAVEAQLGLVSGEQRATRFRAALRSAAVAALERRAADEVVVPSMVRFEVLAGARPSEMTSITMILDACLDAPVDASIADEAPKPSHGASAESIYSGAHRGPHAGSG